MTNTTMPARKDRGAPEASGAVRSGVAAKSATVSMLALVFAAPFAGASLAQTQERANAAAAQCAVPPCKDYATSDVILVDVAKDAETDPVAEAPLSNGAVFPIAVGENTETETAADGPPAGGAGFSISVDGERVAGDAPTPVDAERKTDLGLEAVDIQVKYDGLDQRPMLNVSTRKVRRTYLAGQPVEFLATSNYPGWIQRQEILIYPRDPKQVGKVEPIVVPVGTSGEASWQMPGEGAGEFDYVLRVYDEQGRYDETQPLSIARTDREDLDTHIQDPSQIVSPGNGDDRTAFRNIPVHGGAVTIYGHNVPAGYRVSALGETVPIDRDNQFVIQRILPPGDHTVDVVLSGDDQKEALRFDREVNIPANDWFYVGLADFTIGHRFKDSAIVPAGAGEYERVYSKGRLAFYLKGKIKGKYLLTASADTREDKVQNLFRNLDSKDPKNFLSRINPEDYYPVYGDDSTSVEDAPTRGKFYVRLERGESHVMWGNFKTKVTGSKFLRNERALYGADAVYKSESTTSFGVPKVEAEAYAANAETLPQRDVFRATGGSAYFLKYQDILVGSEVVSVQVRDSLSGRVISTTRLSPGADYEIDTLQGVVLLKRPLNSSTSSTGGTQPGSVGNDEVYLVVQYEHTPTAGDVDGSSFGGRAQAWVGDNVRVGVTGMKEETGAADQMMVGADIVIRKSDTTFLEAEIAQTKGPGFGRSLSSDGGLTIDSDPTAGRPNKTGTAYSVKGQIDLAEITNGQVKGTIGGFYEMLGDGFSSIDHEIDTTKRVWGAFADVALSQRTSVKATYEDVADAKNQQKREGTIDLTYQINDRWEATFGARFLGIDNVRGERHDNTQVIWNGSRTDAGARLTYAPNDDLKIYGFGQATVSRSGNLRRNDRGGLGFEKRLTDRIGVGAEVSYGTSGWGGAASITYDPTTDRSYYLSYRLDPEDSYDLSRLGSSSMDNSGFVIGARHRYNDELSAVAENNLDLFGRKRSLTTTYGVVYTPDTYWTLNGGIEAGRVKDRPLDSIGPGNSDFDRIAPSFSVGYKDEDRLSGHVKAEARFENSRDNTRDQTSYYFAAGLGVKVSEDWRVLANVDAVVSTSNQASVRNGDYIEASLGAAYRPVSNDRFNALFKYVYLYDLPGADQVSAVTGTELGPLQRSHIVSIDGIYDVNQYLSLGAKYGVRIGQTAPRDDRSAWSDSIAHLGIVRADLHIVRNWDLVGEGRVLYSPTAGTTDYGALAAVYRHFGNNVKAGAGYNFGRFSDDLRDLTYDDQGVFFNVIGKF